MNDARQQRKPRGHKKDPPNQFRSDNGDGKRRNRESSEAASATTRVLPLGFRTASLRTVCVLALLLVLGYSLWWNSTAFMDLATNHRRRPDTTLPKPQADGATAATAPSTNHNNTTHTLVVVRCKGNLTWLKDVPSDWTIRVYEKCQDTPSTNHSLLTAKQLGPEECNGYLDYFVDFYDNLDDITVFMHDDGLYPWNRHKDLMDSHTPFSNFGQVVNVTREFLETTPDMGFLHLGVQTLHDKFGMDGYHGESQLQLWPYIRTDAMPDPPIQFHEWISYKPGAHFAVTRQAIHRRPRWNYQALLAQARNPRKGTESRQMCCAMERLWHIFFGVPIDLPLRYRAADLIQHQRNTNHIGTVRLDDDFPAIPIEP